MKRLEFLKRLGLGAIVAAAAPGLLKDAKETEKTFEYTEVAGEYSTTSIQFPARDSKLRIFKEDGTAIDLSDANIKMNIREANKHISTWKPTKIDYNKVEFEYDLLRDREYTYDLNLNGEIINIGKIKT